MRRRARRKEKIAKPPEKTFKYLIRCIGCGKVFLLGKKGADLSKLRCDVCKSELEYSGNNTLTSGINRTSKGSKKMAKSEKKEATKKEGVGDKAKRIRELLVRLEKSNDAYANRKTRSALRKLGHKGGLGKKAKTKAKAKKKAKAKSAA